jgi:hypothetical protein
MAMEFLAFDDQLVSYLAAHEQHDNFTLIHIIQGTQVYRPQFEIGEEIGPQALGGFGRLRGFVLQPGLDSRFQDPLVSDRQRSQLPFGIIGDCDLERHGIASTKSRGPSSGPQ